MKAAVSADSGRHIPDVWLWQAADTAFAWANPNPDEPEPSMSKFSIFDFRFAIGGILLFDCCFLVFKQTSTSRMP